ncbi:MAG: NUDIX domain-containing protein [Chloroflexi bacterium]|nr:NUDIX domain-containing protein [Chloroflexota bacterium]
MDEFLDIVNDEDEIIGRESRAVVHQKGLQHRGVHVLLFTQDKRLLIQQRSADRKAYPSEWDLSVSEHVKAGEEYADAAIRGLSEELGLHNIDLQPLITFRMNYGPNDNEISTLFRGEVDPAAVVFDPVEIGQIEYLKRGQLLKLIHDGNKVVCGWFANIIRWYSGEKEKLQILRIHNPVQIFEAEHGDSSAG